MASLAHGGKRNQSAAKRAAAWQTRIETSSIKQRRQRRIGGMSRRK